MKAVFLLLFAAVALTGIVSFRTGNPCPVHWIWIYRSDLCYFYNSAKLNWAQAERKCKSMKANLASVHSRTDYNYIHWVIRWSSNGRGKTWIGGTDDQTEGTWRWSDGTAFDYRHCGRFDNAHGKQHCLQMVPGGKKCWDDTKCSNKRASVCTKAHPILE